MTAHRAIEIPQRTETALSELRQLILERYPRAEFTVRRGVDEPESFELVAVADVENRHDLLDLVIDRVLAYQLEDGLAIHVIPLRPNNSTWEIAARAAAAAAESER